MLRNAKAKVGQHVACAHADEFLVIDEKNGPEASKGSFDFDRFSGNRGFGHYPLARLRTWSLCRARCEWSERHQVERPDHQPWKDPSRFPGHPFGGDERLDGARAVAVSMPTPVYLSH